MSLDGQSSPGALWPVFWWLVPACWCWPLLCDGFGDELEGDGLGDGDELLGDGVGVTGRVDGGGYVCGALVLIDAVEAMGCVEAPPTAQASRPNTARPAASANSLLRQ
jgi:hypothetical protein